MMILVCIFVFIFLKSMHYIQFIVFYENKYIYCDIIIEVILVGKWGVKNMNKKGKKFTRFTALSVIVLIVILAICARLVYLQIVEAQVYDAKANTKAHKFIKEDAARGNITDSTGKVLATTQQSYNVTYLETDSTKKVFYMFDKNGETQNDEFPIKINGNTYSFDFNTNDPKEIRIDTEKFLEYRGFKDNVMKNLSIDKKWKELTKAE